MTTATTTNVRITCGGETVTMTWDGAQASAPIKVDGVSTQYQTASARHLTGEAVRLVASHVWPESDFADGTEEWDALEYETVDDASEVE